MPQSTTKNSGKNSPIEKRFDESAAKLSKARSAISNIIYGQDEVIDQTLITVMAGGHGLLMGVPGLAKTLLVETLGTALGLDSARVQCTPDLMPADILGSEVLEEGEKGKRSFRFIEGPVFTQLLMADEINRASPRTQSALLQAMQEHEVSIAGQARKLPAPFHVLATQNPIEQEGTYPLPEAQLDRFLLQINVDYPDEKSERAMLLATTGAKKDKAQKALSAKDLMDIQSLVREMPVGDSVADAILKLVRNLRPGESASKQVNDLVAWAPGPRAAQALMLCSRARALLDGREAPSIDDVIALAPPILRHRMALNYKASSEGVTLESMLADMTSAL